MINILRKLHNEFDDHSVKYIGDDTIQIIGKKNNKQGKTNVTYEFTQQVNNPEEYIIGMINRQI